MGGILVVEADPSVCALLVALLDGRPGGVTGRADSTAALALLREGARFDLVLSDDPEVLRAVRESSPGAATVLTAAAGLPEEEADAVLPRPFGIEGFRQTVEKAESLSRARRAALDPRS
ncbi:MAG: hypothetical protein HYY17_09610 [Planctomycetes bacterium]|nr:hypothetical protein [Planctomycetota bacterium]